MIYIVVLLAEVNIAENGHKVHFTLIPFTLALILMLNENEEMIMFLSLLNFVCFWQITKYMKTTNDY